MKQTLGEFRIRTNFNPSNQTLVDQIKQKTAELIDLLEKYPPKSIEEMEEGWQRVEFFRLKSLAQTNYEQAAMWAVKALTL